MCPDAYGLAVGEGKDSAGERVFEGDEARGAGVYVAACDGIGEDISEGEVVRVEGLNREGEGAREGGDAACFPFWVFGWWDGFGKKREEMGIFTSL